MNKWWINFNHEAKQKSLKRVCVYAAVQMFHNIRLSSIIFWYVVEGHSKVQEMHQSHKL